MIEHKDRVPQYPGRVLMTPVPGQANTYDMTRADSPTQVGTAQNKAMFDELLAASGWTSGTATALTLLQNGFQYADGALVRFRLHTATAEGVTLNVAGTGARPLQTANLDENIRAGFGVGTWMTAVLSATRNAYIVQTGGVEPLGIYGVCSTAAATAAKTVTIANFRLEVGAVIGVTFTLGNTVASPSLNVNGTGAKYLYYNGAAVSATVIRTGMTAFLQYNGTNWILINPDLIAFAGSVSPPWEGNTTRTYSLGAKVRNLLMLPTPYYSASYTSSPLLTPGGAAYVPAGGGTTASFSLTADGMSLFYSVSSPYLPAGTIWSYVAFT